MPLTPLASLIPPIPNGRSALTLFTLLSAGLATAALGLVILDALFCRVTYAVAPSPEVRVWIERAVLPEGVRLTAKVELAPGFAENEGPLALSWEFAIERDGRDGPHGTGSHARSAQSGRVRLEPGAAATLATTTLGPARTPCRALLRARVNGQVVGEDAVSCGEVEI